MIVKCGTNDKERLLSYIALDYSHCLYLYLNLKKYDLNSDFIGAYIQEKGNSVTAVMLKYYSCLHVYSRDDNFDAVELVRFFLDSDSTMIYCASKTAHILFKAFPKSAINKVNVTNGWVAQIKQIDQKPQGLSVSAQTNDFSQIVRLIYDDEDIGKSYKYDELTQQLVERNKEGYARNLVIKKEDIVIAHACTNAEFDNIAVVAELLVRKEFRRKGYASEIWREICNELISEGKEVYSFYYSEESRKLHKRIGFFEVCDWTKIVINR